MSKQPKIRVLMVDDHPIVRLGISAVISSQPDLSLVGAAATAEEGIKLFEKHAPDVTLVDVSLPDMNGVELIGVLRTKSPLANFIVLTANQGGNDIAKALQLGARAYLFKDATSDELLNTIRTVALGGKYLSPAVATKLDATASRPELTARELEALRCMVRGHSNSQIADALCVSEDTAKTHVRHILDKLGVNSRSKAVALGLKSGLVQSDDI
jgi:DNA-binding NarL/FixJ family response regulator